MLVFTSCSVIHADEYLNGITWEEPKRVTLDENGVPSDAVVLFNGKDVSAWNNAENWKIVDGAMVSGKGNIVSKESFGDCQFHIEWSAPTPVKGHGQGRGNSGVFFMNTYEIQILDSYENTTYFDGQAGAIYKQTPPQVNATVAPGEWNVYDIIWTAPRFNDDGSLKSPAYITALHNGVLILNHLELKGDTPYHRPPQYTKHAERLPFRIQDHGNPVRFRNIWVREIKDAQGEQTREPFIRNQKTGEETPVK
ncbi:3-keto-disaccharide hydrolase [Thalassoglobus polymorphus]